MYADDTHFTLAGNSVDSIELNLNEDLASVSEWLTASTDVNVPSLPVD